MNKLSIVGAGLVGEAAAQVIARDELCHELMLIDVQGELAQGKALDIWQAAVESGSDTRVQGGAKAEMLAGSDLVVITAGVPRKPGQSRQDVLSINLPILDGILLDIKQHAPAATVLVVSNPVDVLTYRAWARSGLGRNKVFHCRGNGVFRSGHHGPGAGRAWRQHGAADALLRGRVGAIGALPVQ